MENVCVFIKETCPVCKRVTFSDIRNMSDEKHYCCNKHEPKLMRVSYGSELKRTNNTNTVM